MTHHERGVPDVAEQSPVHEEPIRMRDVLPIMRDLIRPHRCLFFAGHLLKPAASLADAAIDAWLIGAIFLLSDTNIIQTVLRTIGFYLAIQIIIISTKYLAEKAQLQAENHIENGFQRRLLRIICGQSLLSYQRRHSGEWLSLVQNDVPEASQMLVSVLAGIARPLIEGLGRLVLMLILVWPIGLFTVMMLIVSQLFNKVFATHHLRDSTHLRESTANLQVHYNEIVQGAVSIRFYRYAMIMLRRIQALFHGDRHVRRKQSFHVSLNGAITGLLGTLAFMAPIIIGVFLVRAGQTTIPRVLMCTQLNGNVTWLFGGLTRSLARVKNSWASWIRIYEVERAARADQGVGLADYSPAPKGTALAWQDVSVTYPGQAEPLFHANTGSLATGSLTVLRGPSGCGKSSLVKAISRILPLTGCVRMNDDERLIYVPQDIRLINDSLRNNVTYWQAIPESELQRIEAVCDLKDIIHSLPKGWEELIQENGANLSGGQRQRMAIARALLCKPTILILDESTSALDILSEQVILQGIKDRFPQLTILLISHRALNPLIKHHEIQWHSLMMHG